MPFIFSSVLDCCCILLFRVVRALLATLKPNIPPLDLGMPDKEGLAMLEEANFDLLPTKVICMICSDDSRDAVRTMNPRARGVALNQSATDLFVKCIHHVVAG
jgi:DNA-binding NarL/FixJ family response regulator